MNGRLASVILSLLCTLHFVGCNNEPSPGEVSPIQVVPRTSPQTEEAAPLVVSPYLHERIRQRQASRDPMTGNATKVRTGSGGGGARIPDPGPATLPHYELEARQEQLNEELEARLDPDESHCEQLLDMMRAAAVTAEEPSMPANEVSRADFMASCQRVPMRIRRCLSPDYARTHEAECERRMDRFDRHSQQQLERAETQWDEVQRGIRTRPDGLTLDEDE